MTEFRNGCITDERTVPVAAAAAFATVATGRGLSNWFPLKAEVEPEVGGRCFLSWGEGCEGEAPVHAYSPDTHFGWTERYPAPDGGEPMIRKVDFHIGPGATDEGAADDPVSEVRLVHSGFDEDLKPESPEIAAYLQGWDNFMHCLEFYLSRHYPENRRLVWRYDDIPEGRAAAWESLIGGKRCSGGLVSLAKGLDPGDPVSFSPVIQAANDPGGPRLPAAVGRITSAQEGGHLSVELPSLGRSLLFIEFEDKRVGVWLSTWGLADEVTKSLQRALDHAMDAAG